MEPSQFEKFGWKEVQAKICIDLASATVAGFAVTPVVVILDTAVTEAAFRRRTLNQSVANSISRFLLRPHRAILTRPFAAVFLLYGATYFVANTVDTFTSKTQSKTASTISPMHQAHKADTESNSGWTKLCAVSGVNMLLSLNKDNQFAKAFGTSLKPRALPLISYVPLVLRDGITLFASFNVPPLLAPYLPEACETVLDRLAVAQLLAPAATQIVVTPLHLLGLDLYHRNVRLPARERLRGMTTGWASTSITRMMRIVPGLAFGNVLNTKIRRNWIARLE